MKIKMCTDSMNILLPMKSFANGNIEIELDKDIKIEENVTVELSIEIKRNEDFYEDD